MVRQASVIKILKLLSSRFSDQFYQPLFGIGNSTDCLFISPYSKNTSQFTWIPTVVIVSGGNIVGEYPISGGSLDSQQWGQITLGYHAGQESYLRVSFRDYSISPTTITYTVNFTATIDPSHLSNGFWTMWRGPGKRQTGVNSFSEMLIAG